MGRLKVLRRWAGHSIYGLLIFCIGGIGSLTYFDSFLPGHDHHHHPYHVSLLEEPFHHHSALPLSGETLVQQFNHWLASRSMTQVDFIMAQPATGSGLAQFFQSGLSHGYILTEAEGDLFQATSLSSSIPAPALAGRSTWPAPLEKPPQ